MRVKRGMEQLRNTRMGEKTGSPRKPVDQRHRPPRFPLAKIRERPRRESNSINRRVTVAAVIDLGGMKPRYRVFGLNVSSTAMSLDKVQVAQGRGTGEEMGRKWAMAFVRIHPSIRLEELNPGPPECESSGLALMRKLATRSFSLCTYTDDSFQNKIEVKHVYTEVDFAIGSQFIRHVLDDSEPMADLQGKDTSSECHTARCGGNTGYSKGQQSMNKQLKLEYTYDFHGQETNVGLADLNCANSARTDSRRAAGGIQVRHARGVLSRLISWAWPGRVCRQGSLSHPVVHVVFDTSWRRLVQLSPSTVTADNQCAVDIGIFVHNTVEYSGPVKFALFFGIKLNFTADFILEQASFLYWLLPGYGATPFLSELYARLYSRMYRYADVNSALVGCLSQWKATIGPAFSRRRHTSCGPMAKGKVDVKHVYTEVDFAIGSQFIRHALDDSDPIADLQGNNSSANKDPFAGRSSQKDTIPAPRASHSESEDGRNHIKGAVSSLCTYLFCASATGVSGKRRNEREEETADPRENPPNNAIVRHDSYMRKSGVTRPGIDPGSPCGSRAG
ncbi:hypothetical protein PR048_029637 [Dryococelus australis]|uniref:Uncharacterized protein n=1 Tax=Dryococelus australis TaxID=614101 RepID=A0ABQ9GGC4_9NEOP|nr:hypothetical protein PR048_029637 [Dryococelus australis]